MNKRFLLFVFSLFFEFTVHPAYAKSANQLLKDSTVMMRMNNCEDASSLIQSLIQHPKATSQQKATAYLFQANCLMKVGNFSAAYRRIRRAHRLNRRLALPSFLEEEVKVYFRKHQRRIRNRRRALRRRKSRRTSKSQARAKTKKKLRLRNIVQVRPLKSHRKEVAPRSQSALSPKVAAPESAPSKKKKLQTLKPPSTRKLIRAQGQRPKAVITARPQTPTRRLASLPPPVPAQTTRLEGRYPRSLWQRHKASILLFSLASLGFAAGAGAAVWNLNANQLFRKQTLRPQEHTIEENQALHRETVLSGGVSLGAFGVSGALLIGGTVALILELKPPRSARKEAR